MKRIHLPFAALAAVGLTVAVMSAPASSDDRPMHKGPMGEMRGDMHEGMRCADGPDDDMPPMMGRGMGMMGMPMMREMMDKLSPDAKKKVEEMKDKMAVMALDHHMAMMKAQIEMMEIVKKDLAK